MSEKLICSMPECENDGVFIYENNKSYCAPCRNKVQTEIIFMDENHICQVNRLNKELALSELREENSSKAMVKFKRLALKYANELYEKDKQLKAIIGFIIHGVNCLGGLSSGKHKCICGLNELLQKIQ